MKKIILFFVLFFTFFMTIQAQEIAENAIGLRLGDSDGFGAEISYQRALSSTNRLELGLGWRNSREFKINALKAKYSAIRLTGLYQWVWQLDGDFNWYAGAGGGFASFSFDDDIFDNEISLFAAGNIGVEYNFDIPLLLSLDFRPEFGFGDYNDDLDFDIALGIRYQF